MSLLWHVPFMLLLGAAASAMAFIPDFGSIDDRAPTIGTLFRFFGIPELRADKAMPIFLAAWGLSGLAINVFASFCFDPYPWWFLADSVVTGMLMGVGAVWVYATLTAPPEEAPSPQDPDNH